MKKEVTIIFKDENLRNGEVKLTVEFGRVSFGEDVVTLERKGYNKEFCDFALCLSDINGGFAFGRTWVEIPVNKIKDLRIKNVTE